jgi:hypothetical protein
LVIDLGNNRGNNLYTKFAPGFTKVFSVSHYPDRNGGGDAESYHLCINSSLPGVDEKVSFIFQFAENRFGLKSGDLNY